MEMMLEGYNKESNRVPSKREWYFLLIHKDKFETIISSLPYEEGNSNLNKMLGYEHPLYAKKD